MRWGPRTLKGQLTLLFLGLTLIPSLLLTLAATRQLWSALDRWENPSVQLALTGSLDLARTLVDRTKNDLRQRGQFLAADPTLGATDRDETDVRGRLADAANVDFVQFYDLTTGELRLEVSRDPLLPTPGNLGPFATPPPEFLSDKQRDLLAHVTVRGDPSGPEELQLTGIYLELGFYDRLDNLSRAITLTHQIAALKVVNQRALIILLVLIVLGLALGATWTARWLAGRVSRPVVDLGHGMERVTQGDDAVRVAPGGTQEMERLIATFNQMSGELSRSRRELAQAERLTAWREVAQRVAHEIKNALTPVTFSLHRLRRSLPALPDADRETFQASLNTVSEEVEGLKRLAASFSELARLPVAELQPVDLVELLTSVSKGFDDPQHPVILELTDAPSVDGDRGLLRQALTNLLKNAAEASPGGSSIRLAAYLTAHHTVVEVDDSGAGWPDGERERALQPYFTTKSDGTGLGLSLVQRTMLQHGGSIRLEDRPEGGARVTLMFPRRGVTRAGIQEDA